MMRQLSEQLNELRPLLKRFSLGTLIAVLIAVYIAFYLIQTVLRNYQLQREIGTLRQQIDTLEVEQDELKYRIQYYQAEAFKEKEARAKLGLQAPGESVVIFPHDDKPDVVEDEQAAPQQRGNRNNPQQWWDFLTGRH